MANNQASLLLQKQLKGFSFILSSFRSDFGIRLVLISSIVVNFVSGFS